MSVIRRSSRPTSCFRMACSRSRRRSLGDQLQRLHRRADRGQRIADLVRDVGGEPFDRLHPVREGVGHVLQRAGEIAQFVLALGDVGQGDRPGPVQPHAVGRRRQPAHRLGDQLGEQERRQQADGDGDGDERDLGGALRGDDLVDVAGFEGQHAQHLAHPLDRDRDRDHPRTVLRHPDAGDHLPLERRSGFRCPGPARRLRRCAASARTPGRRRASRQACSAGGSGVDSTRSAITHEAVGIECPSASNSRTRSLFGIERLSRKSLATSA